jgi:hypothetical protein
MTKLLTAVRSVRTNMRASGPALVALAIAAGLAPDVARAWGMDYESAGRTIGSEIGRAAGGNQIFSPAGRIGSVIGEMAGAAIGRPFDAASRESDRQQQAIKEAQDQARRDAAYDAERKRLDPTYTPAARYADMSARAEAAAQQWRAVSGNVEVNHQRLDGLAQEWERRNARPRAR